MLAKFYSTSFHQYGGPGELTTPQNLFRLQPDPYKAIPLMNATWEWMGCLDGCSNELQILENDIKRNGDKSVGLVWEIAVIPSHSTLEGIWYRNKIAVPGLKIKLSVVDMQGEVFATLPKAEVDLSLDPKAAAMLCQECTGGVDTFYKYEFDHTKDKLMTTSCNTAILRLEIIEEPTGGLLGTDCSSLPTIGFEGGLMYRSYCNLRDVIADDCYGDLSCLDKCHDSKPFADSKRGKELV